MQRTTQSFLAILVISLGGYAAWRVILAAEPEPSSAPPRDVGPPRVSLLRLEAHDLQLELEAYGSLEARRQVELALEVSGPIIEVLEHWRPGLAVQEGTLLVRVDPSLYALEVLEARAVLGEAHAAVALAQVQSDRAGLDRDILAEALDVAQRQHERMVGLEGVASDTQRDQALGGKLDAERALEVARGAVQASAAALLQARARVASAEASVARGEELLARTSLRAPFAGRLRGHGPSVGALVRAREPFAQLVDPDSVVLSVRVPERELARLAEGQAARISFPGNPESPAAPELEAHVSAVDIASDPSLRRAIVELAWKHAAGGPGLPVGLFGHAIIEIETIADALWIDRRHFVWQAGEAVAFVARGEGQLRAERRVLRLGSSYGEGFVVLGGLAPGEQLVTAPLDRMLDDMQLGLAAAPAARDAATTKDDSQL